MDMFGFCWHDWKEIKVQIAKNVCFGFGSSGSPGYRVTEKCTKCSKKRYMKLNLMMPDSCLMDELLWRKD